MIAIESRIERCVRAEIAAPEPSVDGTVLTVKVYTRHSRSLSKAGPLGFGEMQLREIAVDLPGRQRQVHHR